METQVRDAAQGTAVRLDESSRAGSLKEDTRKRSFQSLSFFLTSVLSMPVPPKIADELQALGLRRLVMLLAGSVLWCKLHKQKFTTDPADNEAVRWLFPETKDF